MRIRDRLPNVPFDRRLDPRFSFFILSAAVDSLPVTDATVEQDICPCPHHVLCLYLSLSPSHRKVSLCARLYQLRTYFRVKIVVPCISEKSNRVQFSCLENSNIVQSNIRRKRIVLLVIIVTRSVFSVIASGIS